MKKIVDPFTVLLPSLDLHEMDRVLAKINIEEFILDNVKLRNKQIVIIHGIGEGILRKEVSKVLSRNKNVESFKLNAMNIGCTIVNLKID